MLPLAHAPLLYSKGTGLQAFVFSGKAIKAWRREKKINLIESNNCDWEDLSRDWYD